MNLLGCFEQKLLSEEFGSKILLVFYEDRQGRALCPPLVSVDKSPGFWVTFGMHGFLLLDAFLPEALGCAVRWPVKLSLPNTVPTV